MSATAFQRLRREALAKAKENVIDINNLKVDEIKKLLEDKGIEYDSKAKKAELLELLKTDKEPDKEPDKEEPGNENEGAE